MGFLSRGMTTEEVAMAIKGAVTDATTQTIVSAHIAECIKDKAEIKASLAKQDADRVTMHAQNQERFDRINRTIYIATGAAVCLSFLSSNAGHELLLRFFH